MHTSTILSSVDSSDSRPNDEIILSKQVIFSVIEIISFSFKARTEKDNNYHHFLWGLYDIFHSDFLGDWL